MKLLIFVGLIAMAAAGDGDDALLKQSNNRFTANMFSEVVKENPGKSVILSAFSVLPPLAQLGLGTKEDSKSHDEILTAIGIPNDNAIKDVFKGVNSKLRAVQGVELKMANRIYIADDAQLNPTFAQVSRDVFDSDVKNVNFVDSIKTAGEINSWVEEQTNNKIKDLLDANSVDGSTRAVLVNAIYFKGSWKNPFEPFLTRDADFHVTKDKTVKVPTMHKTATFMYGESSELDAKLLEMFYEGEQSSLLIALPNKVDGLESLQEKLKDPDALQKAAGQMFQTEVIVSLPKFKIETTTNLKKVLQNLNIKKLFDPSEAKLSNLLAGESNIYISDAIQKAYIEVNEEGAEAAAANEYNVSYLSAIVQETANFFANHPFVFYLTERQNIIFNGVYQS